MLYNRRVANFESLAEARIRDAIEEGRFDDVPGMGEPLELEDLSRIPEDLRGSYTILKNANVLPEEMCLRKELVTMENLLRACRDEVVADELRGRMEDLSLRYSILMERRLGRSLPGQYRMAAAARLRGL